MSAEDRDTSTHIWMSVCMCKTKKKRKMCESSQSWPVRWMFQFFFFTTCIEAIFVLFSLPFFFSFIFFTVLVLFAFSWHFFLYTEYKPGIVQWFTGEYERFPSISFHTLFSFAYYYIVADKKTKLRNIGFARTFAAGYYFFFFFFNFQLMHTYVWRRCTYENRLLSWVKWACRIWHQHFYTQTLSKVGSYIYIYTELLCEKMQTSLVLYFGST